MRAAGVASREVKDVKNAEKRSRWQTAGYIIRGLVMKLIRGMAGEVLAVDCGRLLLLLVVNLEKWLWSSQALAFTERQANRLSDSSVSPWVFQYAMLDELLYLLPLFFQRIRLFLSLVT
jgi:hypothetical protein